MSVAVGLVVVVLVVPPVWWLAGGGRALGPGWWLVAALGWFALSWMLWADDGGFWWGLGCCAVATLCAAEGRARVNQPPPYP